LQHVLELTANLFCVTVALLCLMLVRRSTKLI